MQIFNDCFYTQRIFTAHEFYKNLQIAYVTYALFLNSSFEEWILHEVCTKLHIMIVLAG